MNALLATSLLLGCRPTAHPKIVVNLDNGQSFTLQLDAEAAPKTVAGIVALVKKGFYNGQRIHRVVPGFVIQWGDPLSRNGVDAPGVGTGGSGRPIPFEAGRRPFVLGTLGMASTGAKVGGDSQMFVVIGAEANFLNGNYSAFGSVTSGMNVVQNVRLGDRILSMLVVG